MSYSSDSDHMVSPAAHTTEAEAKRRRDRCVAKRGDAVPVSSNYYTGPTPSPGPGSPSNPNLWSYHVLENSENVDKKNEHDHHKHDIDINDNGHAILTHRQRRYNKQGPKRNTIAPLQRTRSPPGS